MSLVKLSLRDKITGVVVRTPQGYFCLDPDEQFVSKSIIQTGSYGLGEIALAKTFLTQQSRMLVVGAHIGTIVVPLCRFCRDVVAVEANPETYLLLELNMLMNRCNNLTIHSAAANDEKREIMFVANKVNSGGSKRMPIHKDHAYFYDNPKIISVQGVPLDDLLDQHDFDLVFMDIEGSEYFAFLGMQDILRNTRTLIVEFLPHHLSRVAGISVSEFLEPLAKHFSRLTVPSLNQEIGRSGFLRTLTDMFNQGRGDTGIVFSK